MPLTNAERQRRFIARLKTKASSAPDNRLTPDPLPPIRIYGMDPDWTSEEKKMLPTGWDRIEVEADHVITRLSSTAFGRGTEKRLSALRDVVHLIECAGPQFLSVTKRYIAFLEADLQYKEPSQRKKRKSLG